MNTKIVLTLFIAFIMITSIIGFIWSSNSNDNNYETLEYNNHQFKKINGKYTLELNNNEYVFDNTPYELSDINIDNLNLESDKYYLIFNPVEKDLNMEYYMQKLYLVLKSSGVNVQLACSTNEGCDNSMPVKNCDDYSFYLKRSEDAKVYKDNKCVVIQGDNLNINKEIDKINLILLKVV